MSRLRQRLTRTENAKFFVRASEKKMKLRVVHDRHNSFTGNAVLVNRLNFCRRCFDLNSFGGERCSFFARSSRALNHGWEDLRHHTNFFFG